MVAMFAVSLFRYNDHRNICNPLNISEANPPKKKIVAHKTEVLTDSCLTHSLSTVLIIKTAMKPDANDPTKHENIDEQKLSANNAKFFTLLLMNTMHTFYWRHVSW